jgi:hypothetical protein
MAVNGAVKIDAIIPKIKGQAYELLRRNSFGIAIGRRSFHEGNRPKAAEYKIAAYDFLRK